MKKNFLIIVFFLLIVNLFAKEQIGECNKNVYNVGIIQNNVPVCFYYEDIEGLISVINKFYIKIGNEDFGPYDSIDSWLFTSDKIIYTARINDEICLFINGKCLEHYKGISNFFIADDKESLIYAYECESGVYIKSKLNEFGPFEQVKYFLVDNNKIVSYVVKEKKNYYIYTEKNKYGPFDDVPDWIYQNNNYAYKVIINNKEYIYDKNGFFSGPFDTVYLRSFSIDGTQLAYETIEEDKNTKSIPAINSTLWVNKNKVAEGWIISNISFVGNSLIYSIFTKQEGNFIFFADKKYGPFRQIREVKNFPNQNKFAFSYSNNYAPNEKYYLRVGDEKAGPYDDCYYITFSEDGSNVAYVIKDDNDRYLVNKINKFGPYESISNILFSEDGKNLVYVSSDEYFKNQILHKDDFQSKEYDFITNINFYKNILTYTAERNGICYKKILLKNIELIGNYVNEKFVYIENGTIYIE